MIAAIAEKIYGDIKNEGYVDNLIGAFTNLIDAPFVAVEYDSLSPLPYQAAIAFTA